MSDKPLEGNGSGLQAQSVTWEMRDRRGQEISVRFAYEDGKPTTISLLWRGESDVSGYEEDNHQGTWRSCITHVLQLVRQFCYRPKNPERRELTAHEKQRLGKAKPELKVFGT